VTESGLKLILWIVAMGLIGATIAIPQAVDPWELPSLVLDREAVSDAIELDRALAREVPDSPQAQRLRALFLDHGRSEANPPYERAVYDKRQVAIYEAIEALVSANGELAFDAMRVQAVEDFINVLEDGTREPNDDYEVGVVGGMREILNRYGMIRDRVIIAPEMAIRAFYKARWSSVHRRAPIDGFSAIELQAYWGWLALHGWGRPLQQREDALLAFADVGGFGAQEAAALLDLLAGRPDRASKSLRELYSVSGELRLRNLALGARHVVLFPRGAP
jgi:hypothetical protein